MLSCVKQARKLGDKVIYSWSWQLFSPEWHALSETFEASLGRSLPGMTKAGVEEEEPLLWAGRVEEDLLSHNFPFLRTCIFKPNFCGLEPKEGKKGPKK